MISGKIVGTDLAPVIANKKLVPQIFWRFKSTDGDIASQEWGGFLKFSKI